MLSAMTHSSPRGWARVIEESVGERANWSPAELGDALRHQLDAQWDMASMSGADSRDVTGHGSRSSIQRFQSMGELLTAADPPVQLLEKAKEFAKANYAHPESLLPPEVSLVLYFASIAVAEVHCRTRISRLDAVALRTGFEWALGLSWLDHRLRVLIGGAIRDLEKPGING
jgi:hypothetical protein